MLSAFNFFLLHDPISCAFVVVLALDAFVFLSPRVLIRPYPISTSFQLSTQIQQLQTDTSAARLDGYDNIISGHVAVYEQYKRALANKEEGVCARVKIEIVQSVTMTRVGFDALLQACR